MYVLMQDTEQMPTLNVVQERLTRRVSQNQAQLKQANIRLERIEKLLVHLCGGKASKEVKLAPERTLSKILSLPPIPQESAKSSDDESKV